MKKIVVIFPTAVERKYFDVPGVEVCVGGVGLTASAYATAKVIQEHRPDVLILGGIAGVYAHSPLKIGETVLVSAECEADLGVFHDDGFRHIAKMHLDMNFDTNFFLECPYIPADSPLPTAKSNSMNAAIAPFVETAHAEIENMEGSAFFYVCLKEGVRFYEVRSISNEVNTDHAAWDYDKSIRNMNNGVIKLIEYLRNEDKD